MIEKPKSIIKYVKWLIFKERVFWDGLTTWRLKRIGFVGERILQYERMRIAKELTNKINRTLKARNEISQYKYRHSPKIKINGKGYAILDNKVNTN